MMAKKKILVLMTVALLLAANATAQTVSESPIPSDAEIRKILVDRIDTARQSVGIVVALLNRPGAGSSPTAALKKAIRAFSTATLSLRSDR